MFKPIILMNMAKFTIPLGENVWESAPDGVPVVVVSDGDERNILEWLLFVGFGDTNIINIEVTDVVYIYIEFNNRVDYARFHADLRVALGFVGDAAPASRDYTAERFGTYRLPIQGVDHPPDPLVCAAREQSKMTDMNLIEYNGNNETFESIDYLTNNYDGDFDVKRWTFEVSDFPYAYRQQVIDFFSVITAVVSDSPPVILFNEGFYITETDYFKVIMSIYKGMEIQAYTNKYLGFKFGLREFVE